MSNVLTYTGSASGTTDTGGLSTDLMVTLGVGILTLAAIILVSCCKRNVATIRYKVSQSCTHHDTSQYILMDRVEIGN